jgi:hypothetical protein
MSLQFSLVPLSAFVCSYHLIICNYSFIIGHFEIHIIWGTKFTPNKNIARVKINVSIKWYVVSYTIPG